MRVDTSLWWWTNVWQQTLAWHPQIRSCFSWNHGRGGWLGPGEEKSRMKWSLKIQMKWSDSVQEEWLSHPRDACYQMSDTMHRRWKRQIAKKTGQHLVTLWKKKKAINGWGPTKDGVMTRHLQTVSISPQPDDRQESILETRKDCTGTKEKLFASSRINTFSQ